MLAHEAKPPESENGAPPGGDAKEPAAKRAKHGVSEGLPRTAVYLPLHFSNTARRRYPPRSPHGVLAPPHPCGSADTTSRALPAAPRCLAQAGR